MLARLKDASETTCTAAREAELAGCPSWLDRRTNAVRRTAIVNGTKQR